MIVLTKMIFVAIVLLFGYCNFQREILAFWLSGRRVIVLIILHFLVFLSSSCSSSSQRALGW
jgi:hypothetical protein